jgi:hypothetical protein
MRILKIVTLLCAMLSGSAIAAGMQPAPSMTVGGFVIGQPLPQDCAASDQAPCVLHDAAAIGGKTRLKFQAETPGLNGQHLPEAIVVDGKLEGVRIFTTGIDSQRAWLKTLSDKYGKPLELADVQTRNRMGATFSVIRAGWVFSDLVVTFDGASKQIDLGVVTIETQKGMAAEEATQSPSSL